MKPRYTLIWSQTWGEWVCIDTSQKPQDLSAREYFLTKALYNQTMFYRYLTN